MPGDCPAIYQRIARGRYPAPYKDATIEGEPGREVGGAGGRREAIPGISLPVWPCMKLERGITIMQVGPGNYLLWLRGLRCRSRNGIMRKWRRIFGRCMRVIGSFIRRLRRDDSCPFRMLRLLFFNTHFFYNGGVNISVLKDTILLLFFTFSIWMNISNSSLQVYIVQFIVQFHFRLQECLK